MAPSIKFRGRKVAIVSASDENFLELALGLHRSLGRWGRAFHLIDIGSGDTVRCEAERRGIKILAMPDGFFGDTSFARPYMRALYLRPRLPELLDADLIIWIDADCWVQRRDAIETYLDGAVRFPESFTVAPLVDVDYPRCIGGYLAYQESYRGMHRRLFGDEEADFLFGRAIFSAGVFAADRRSPVWADWWRETHRQYATNTNVQTDAALAHMAEQQSLNKVLHRTGRYNCLTADMNWHCHCSDTVREGSTVRILPSRRVPSILHLAMFGDRADEYRQKRLLYEPPRWRAWLDAAHHRIMAR